MSLDTGVSINGVCVSHNELVTCPWYISCFSHYTCYCRKSSNQPLSHWWLSLSVSVVVLCCLEKFKPEGVGQKPATKPTKHGYGKRLSLDFLLVIEEEMNSCRRSRFSRWKFWRSLCWTHLTGHCSLPKPRTQPVLSPAQFGALELICAASLAFCCIHGQNVIGTIGCDLVMGMASLLIEGDDIFLHFVGTDLWWSLDEPWQCVIEATAQADEL